MTDINSIHSVGGPGGVDPSRPEKRQNANLGPNAPSFSDLLDKTCHAGDVGAVDGSSATGRPSPLPPTYIGPLETASIQETVRWESNDFFKVVDSLQSHLKNPSSSIKDIAPLMRDMEIQRDRLMDQIPTLPQGDTGRAILEEIATVLTSETAKFNRGEYI